MADREQILRTGITTTDKIIEIGPSFNPLAPKRDGWCSYSVDHTDQEGLVNKYRQDPSVNVGLIEPVDFVWTEGKLSDAVPVEHHGTFDVFLASHVIEHIPDLIGFLSSAEVLCRPSAKMTLAIPDKRVCFDFFRPLSTTGDFLVAHWERRSRHSPKSLWDYFAYQVTKNGAPGWGRTDQAPVAFTYAVDEALAWTQKHDRGAYIDAHGSTFVPASFALILLELARVGFTDWYIERSEAAEYTEFYVWLQRGGLARAAALSDADLATERAHLLLEVMLQLEDQARQIPSNRDSLREHELVCLRERVAQLQQSEAELIARLERIQAELLEARSANEAMRLGVAWRAQSFLQRLLRPSTILPNPPARR